VFILDVVGLVRRYHSLERLVPEVTCYVSSGTLNSAHSVNVEQKNKKHSMSSGCTLEELAYDPSSEGQLVPAFIRVCVEYVEHEGLTSEGLYRVPGNKAHVEQLVETLRQGMQCVTL